MSTQIDNVILDAHYMMSLETCLHYFIMGEAPLFKQWLYICQKNEDFPISIGSYRPSMVMRLILQYIRLSSEHANDGWAIYKTKDGMLYLKNVNGDIADDGPISIGEDDKMVSAIEMLECDKRYKMEEWPLPANKGQLMKWLRGMHILEDNNMTIILGIIDEGLAGITYPVSTIIDKWIYDDLHIILMSLMKIRVIDWINKIYNK